MYVCMYVSTCVCMYVMITLRYVVFFMTIRRLVTQFDICLSTKPYFLNINECL